MPIQILMPALSPTMTEGNLAKWQKKEGDKVKAGDIIAEIETDKATMEFEAVDEGTLGRILVPEGTTGVKVNQPIAVILEEGESAGDIKAPPPASAAKPATPEAPKPAAARRNPASRCRSCTARVRMAASSRPMSRPPNPAAARAAGLGGLDIGLD